MKKIFVLLPVFNRLEYTKKCLASFYRQRHTNFQIILVDSDSTDGTREYVRSHFPEVIIIHGTNEWWWTRAMQEGLQLALKLAKTGDYVLEMNNDCVFEPGYLNQLLKTSQKYRKSIVGSMCVSIDDPSYVVEAGIRIHWPTGLVWGVAPAISTQKEYFQKMEVVDKLDALPGKGTLIPIKVFLDLGGYAVKELPHYIADYELTNRAKRAGYTLLVDTRAIVGHWWKATGISSSEWNRKSYKSAWNLLFGRKSMNNIVDWVNFITLACPPEYRKQNYFQAFLRVFNGAFSVFPLYYIKPWLPSMLRVISKIYQATSLFIYRVKLKISQFPEYHLKKHVRNSR